MSIQTSNLAYFLYYLIILYQTIENLKNKLIKFFSLLFIRFPVCFLEKHTPTTTIQSPSLFDMLNSPLLFSPTTTTSLHQIDLLDPTTTTYTRTSMKSIFFFFFSSFSIIQERNTKRNLCYSDARLVLHNPDHLPYMHPPSNSELRYWSLMFTQVTHLSSNI